MWAVAHMSLVAFEERRLEFRAGWALLEQLRQECPPEWDHAPDFSTAEFYGIPIKRNSINNHFELYERPRPRP